MLKLNKRSFSTTVLCGGLTFRALSRGDGAAILGEVELGNVGQLLY
jgi:hypothetical protein